MPSCYDCGKILASPAGLRRHVNSQHEQSEWHFCECGKRFLDPAARSRCRAGHSRSFGCSAWGCDYRSCRKDSVKQHIRRRHAGFPELQVLTFPLNLGYSGWPSNTGLAAEFAPAPSELISFPPAILQPQVDTPIAYFPPSPQYNPEASPEYWPHFASGIAPSAYVPPL